MAKEIVTHEHDKRNREPVTTVVLPPRRLFLLLSRSLRSLPAEARSPAAETVVKSSRDFLLRPTADTGEGGPLLHVGGWPRVLGDGGLDSCK